MLFSAINFSQLHLSSKTRKKREERGCSVEKERGRAVGGREIERKGERGGKRKRDRQTDREGRGVYSAAISLG